MDDLHEVPKRRVPLQSVRGEDERSTETLRLLFYLVEVERQAEVFNLAFADAMRSAISTGASTEAWRHLQSAMFAAIIVNRLVSREQSPHPWAGANGPEARQIARDAAIWRSERLRQLLALPERDDDTPIFTVRGIRDSLEHVDERLDMALHSSVSSLSDWYVSSGWLLVSAEHTGGAPRAGLRAFYPEGGLVFFDRERIDMFMLDRDMLALRHNAREAQQELLDTLSGRHRFGGDTQAVKVAEHLQDRRQSWQEQRAEIERTFAPTPRGLDGYVRLWMQNDESTTVDAD